MWHLIDPLDCVYDPLFQKVETIGQKNLSPEKWASAECNTMPQLQLHASTVPEMNGNTIK